MTFLHQTFGYLIFERSADSCNPCVYSCTWTREEMLRRGSRYFESTVLTLGMRNPSAPQTAREIFSRAKRHWRSQWDLPISAMDGSKKATSQWLSNNMPITLAAVTLPRRPIIKEMHTAIALWMKVKCVSDRPCDAIVIYFTSDSSDTSQLLTHSPRLPPSRRATARHTGKWPTTECPQE